jgi:hypothetical protein
MAHIPSVSAGELIRTTWGNPVAVELNTRCIKVNGEIGEGAAGVANQWMTGALVINAGPSLKLRRSGDTPFFQFENTTGATTFATIQATPTQVNYNVVSASGEHRFLVNSAEKLAVDSTGLTMAGFTSTGRGTYGGNGELIRLVDTSTGGSDFHDLYMAFYGAGVSLASPGVRTGYVGYNSSSTLQLRNEIIDGDALVQTAGSGSISLVTASGGVAISSTTGNISLTCSGATGGTITIDTSPVGDINLVAGDSINLAAGGAFQGMMDGPVLLWGKAASDVANAGIELLGTGVASGQEGQIRSTIGAAGSGVSTENVALNRIGTAEVTNGQYIVFNRDGAYTGGILERATTGIILDEAVVSAPSDYRLKDDLGPVVDGLDRVMMLRPRQVRWKGTGEPDEVFIAHQLGEVLPWLVGGEKDAVTDSGEIKPQTIREAGLLPVIVAAVQELAARVDDLEGHN